MKKTILAAIIVLFVGCAKEKAPAPPAAMLTPSETVVNLCTALGKHDSTTYVNLISSSRRRMYESNPMLLTKTLSYWAIHRPDVHVLSESQNGNVATVTYRLRFAASRLVDTTETAVLVLENGAWKYAR